MHERHPLKGLSLLKSSEPYQMRPLPWDLYLHVYVVKLTSFCTSAYSFAFLNHCTRSGYTVLAIKPYIEENKLTIISSSGVFKISFIFTKYVKAVGSKQPP